MAVHGTESPTARIRAVPAAVETTDVIAMVAPRMPRPLWRQAVTTLTTFDRTWPTSVFCDASALGALALAAVLTVMFRGAYAAQPLLIVAGIAAAGLVLDLTWGLAVLWRRRRRGGS